MPKTLLLADDSVTIQKVVGISFANEDVVLLTVDNGDDAITRARESRPDLVLADVAMPGRDGYEVCEAIKSDPELRSVPVLLLSGTFESFDEDRARRVGADGHITKPFEAQALVDRVHELLAGAAAPPPAAPTPDATVVVEAEPARSEAFDFFDEEFAQTAPSAALATPPESAAGAEPDESAEPIELHTAVEDEVGDAEDALTVTDAVLSEPRRREEPATVLLEDAVPVLEGEPTSASDPRVSFGRLGEDVHAATLSGLTPAATQLLETDGDEEGLRSEGSFDFGFDDEQPAHGEASAGPVLAPDTAVMERSFAPADASAEDDLYQSEIGAAASPLGDPPGPPPVPMPPPVPARGVVEPAAAPAVPAVEAAPPARHPDAMGRELREHLEKVAWDAFGDLSERIVRETLARVEAIAWEVIPQLAEALIREEIRRLKDGEDPEDR